MKHNIIAAAFCCIFFALTSCNNEPHWADPAAHARTEELNKLYGPLLVGTWHTQRFYASRRYFEQLTFAGDGSVSGYRKWHQRKLVTINGEKVYTDWEEISEMTGSFTGTWKLRHCQPAGCEKADYLHIHADYDEEHFSHAYAENMLFGEVNDTLLRISGKYAKDETGWTIFRRGAAEPDF